MWGSSVSQSQHSWSMCCASEFESGPAGYLQGPRGVLSQRGQLELGRRRHFTTSDSELADAERAHFIFCWCTVQGEVGPLRPSYAVVVFTNLHSCNIRFFPPIYSVSCCNTHAFIQKSTIPPSSNFPVLFSTCNSSRSSPMTAAFLQSMTSEKGSSQPLLRITGIQAACEQIQAKQTWAEILFLSRSRNDV